VGPGRTSPHGSSSAPPPDPFTGRAGLGGASVRPWRCRRPATSLRPDPSDGVPARRRAPHRPRHGLFRLFWIPARSVPPRRVRPVPAPAPADILTLESERRGAFVVGEDLGTVEDLVREEMAARHILSYRLLWVRDGPPSGYRPECWRPDHARPAHADRHLGGLDPDGRARAPAPPHRVGDGSTCDVAEAAHRALAASPSKRWPPRSRTRSASPSGPTSRARPWSGRTGRSRSRSASRRLRQDRRPRPVWPILRR